MPKVVGAVLQLRRGSVVHADRCGRIRSILVLAAVALLALGMPAAGETTEPAPNSPEWFAREAANFADAFGRQQDQMSNPDYLSRWQAARAAGLSDADDPYRAAAFWNGVRGEMRAVRYLNRYGASISGHLWSPLLPFKEPVGGMVTTGPLPTVIVLTGLCSSDPGSTCEQAYWWAAEDLAENGYLVLTFDPQGAGASDRNPDSVAPNDPSHDAPGDPVYCDPDPSASWRQPQEMGIREMGSCAGVPPPGVGAMTPEALMDAIVASKVYQEPPSGLQEVYRAVRPNSVFGALDAVAWLTSDANPWRDRVDRTRIGVVGHSLGAHSALMAANGDPLRRFSAGIAWDSFAYLDNGVSVRVPSQIQQSEQEALVGPRAFTPDPTSYYVTRADYEQAVADGIDALFMVLRASTHPEWMTTAPDQSLASRKGQRVALYYSLAWFDRYVKGKRTSVHRFDRKIQAADALRRITALTFDGSADRTSIGSGNYDPTSQKNMPYTIVDERVTEHMSLNYTSTYAVTGSSCRNMRLGC